MKNLKKVLALVLAVVMIMGTVAVASAKDYSDVKTDNDYAVAIDVLSNLEILNGFPDETFRPDGLLTRAEAAKIVAIIHNAATNGKIDADIADLYKNAQNSFVDCNNSWALPYINYCRITGLADGMTTTTYEPNRKLTGVQFLKLMLTTLNFDSAKEGYTGKGWDINVLNRANEVGLTDGLAEGWQGIAELKRGEAAQIIYNALTKYLVEYGQLVKNNYVNSTDKKDGYYASSFISNEQVAKSGYTLAKKMGVTVARSTDAFRRPGYTWSYGSWSGFYMDTPIAEYKTTVSECDLLVAMGVAENKTTPVDLNGFVGGDKAEGSVGENFTDYGTALNYYAVDGFKFADTRKGTYYDGVYADGITLQHDSKRECKKVENHRFGGQGDLTQLFETEDGFVLTTIHTFLGEVTAVNANNRKTHATGETSDVKVWLYSFMNGEEPANEVDDIIYRGEDYANYSVKTTAFAKGAKLNVTVSLKAAQDALKTNTETLNYAKGTIVDKAAAESKTGKLTGASGVTYADTTTIDGTKYNDNCRFVLGKDLSKNILHYNESFTFYFDSYGNVIGCEELGAGSEYVVMDRIYGEHVKGKFVVKADLYNLAGEKLEDVTVSTKAGSFDGYVEGWDNVTTTTSDVIYTEDEKNDPELTDALYAYSVDADGVYTLTWVGEFEATNGYSRWDAQSDDEFGMFVHAAKMAHIKYMNEGSPVDMVNFSESTKFVVKGVDGTWKTYTGATALPALSARYLDWVDTDNDGYADIVYIGEASYEGDKVTGYVAKWTPFRWDNNYDVIVVYVDGEAKELYLKHDDQRHEEPGMYEFKTAVDENGYTFVTYKKALTTTVYAEGVASMSADGSAITVGKIEDDVFVEIASAINLTDIPVYGVHNDGTITVESKDYINASDDVDEMDYVVIYWNNSTHEIVSIFVYDTNPNA